MTTPPPAPHPRSRRTEGGGTPHASSVVDTLMVRRAKTGVCSLLHTHVRRELTGEDLC